MNDAVCSKQDTLRLLAETARLRHENERLHMIEGWVQQLALAYKREADNYASTDGEKVTWVQFTRGRQDAYESVMRWFSEARQALEGSQ